MSSAYLRLLIFLLAIHHSWSQILFFSSWVLSESTFPPSTPSPHWIPSYYLELQNYLLVFGLTSLTFWSLNKSTSNKKMCSVPPVFSELIWVLQAIKERHKCPYIHPKTERLFNDVVCTTNATARRGKTVVMVIKFLNIDPKCCRNSAKERQGRLHMESKSWFGAWRNGRAWTCREEKEKQITIFQQRIVSQ